MAGNHRQSLRALQERLANRLAEAKASGADAAWLAVEARGGRYLLPLVQSVSVKSPSGPGGRRPAPPCLCPRAPPAYTFCAFAPAAAAAAAAAPALASPTSSPHPLPCLTTRP